MQRTVLYRRRGCEQWKKKAVSYVQKERYPLRDMQVCTWQVYCGDVNVTSLELNAIKLSAIYN